MYICVGKTWKKTPGKTTGKMWKGRKSQLGGTNVYYDVFNITIREVFNCWLIPLNINQFFNQRNSPSILRGDWFIQHQCSFKRSKLQNVVFASHHLDISQIWAGCRPTVSSNCLKWMVLAFIYFWFVERPNEPEIKYASPYLCTYYYLNFVGDQHCLGVT